MLYKHLQLMHSSCGGGNILLHKIWQVEVERNITNLCTSLSGLYIIMAPAKVTSQQGHCSTTLIYMPNLTSRLERVQPSDIMRYWQHYVAAWQWSSTRLTWTDSDFCHRTLRTQKLPENVAPSASVPKFVFLNRPLKFPKTFKDCCNILTWPFIGKLSRSTLWWY
jgi:hypothetical protein